MDKPVHPYPGSSHQEGSSPPHYGALPSSRAPVNSDHPPSTSPTADGKAVQIMPLQDEDQNAEDFYKLSPHVPIAFDDTFKESSSIRGFSFMTNVNGAIYEYTHFFLYATLTLIIGPILAFVWAILFAIMHIFTIWFIQPSIKMFYISMRTSSLLVAPAIRLFLDPLYKSMSLMLSGIKGQFRINNSDITLNVKTAQV